MAPIKEDVRPAKPEEQELARKRDEQSTLETELAERELRAANLRAELGAFERRYLHEVGLRYAELDELKAQIAELAAKKQPGAERAQEAARDARARADETKSVAQEEEKRARPEVIQSVARNEEAVSRGRQTHSSRPDLGPGRTHAAATPDGRSQQGLRAGRRKPAQQNFE